MFKKRRKKEINLFKYIFITTDVSEFKMQAYNNKISSESEPQ